MLKSNLSVHIVTKMNFYIFVTKDFAAQMLGQFKQMVKDLALILQKKYVICII